MNKIKNRLRRPTKMSEKIKKKQLKILLLCSVLPHMKRSIGKLMIVNEIFCYGIELIRHSAQIMNRTIIIFLPLTIDFRHSYIRLKIKQDLNRKLELTFDNTKTMNKCIGN